MDGLGPTALLLIPITADPVRAITMDLATQPSAPLSVTARLVIMGKIVNIASRTYTSSPGSAQVAAQTGMGCATTLPKCVLVGLAGLGPIVESLMLASSPNSCPTLLIYYPV